TGVSASPGGAQGGGDERERPLELVAALVLKGGGGEQRPQRLTDVSGGAAERYGHFTDGRGRRVIRDKAAAKFGGDVLGSCGMRGSDLEHAIEIISGDPLKLVLRAMCIGAFEGLSQHFLRAEIVQ